MKILQLIKFISALFVFAVLVSCGATDGGGTDSQTTAATSGRVSLLLTDGPTLDFDRINVTLESVSFIGEDDGHETIVFNESRVVNLLALQNYSDLLTTAIIPAGIYNKIRLHVSQVELVRLDKNGDVVFSENAKLPANGKIDLNPQEPFEVIGNGHLVMEFDMDAEKSIHIVETGNGKFNFRPVIFVNILGEEELKLVILDGKVLGKTETGFQLCKVDVMAVNDSCMAVAITGNTVVQVEKDDQIEAVPAGSVEDDDIVTVLGKAGSKNVSALHIVIATDNADDLALFTGAATSTVNVDDKFGMTTDDDNVVVQPLTMLTVTLADSARIFDKFGTVATSDNIVAGSDVDVFGLALPDLATVKDVKAAFVIYDNDKNSSNITGTIADIYGTESKIIVTVVDGQATINECVDIKDAYLFLLTIENKKIVRQEISIKDLKLGMTVDVYGDSSDPGCLSADVVLVTEAL